MRKFAIGMLAGMLVFALILYFALRTAPKPTAQVGFNVDDGAVYSRPCPWYPFGDACERATAVRL